MTYEERLDNTLLHLRELMLEKYHYSEHILKEFGELGMLVRASDEVERLKGNILDGDCFCEDTQVPWMKLAGYAVQAIMLFHEDETEDILEEMDKEDEFNEIASAIDEDRFPGIRLIFLGE